MTTNYVYNLFLNQSHRFPKRDVDNTLKIPDNCFPNNIAISFNGHPEQIERKLYGFEKNSFRHFISSR